MAPDQALPQQDRPSGHWWPIILLVFIGLVHRLGLFAFYFDDIAAMVSNNPNWLTWQYLTLPALRDNLLDSLLYLQQTPPLPQLFLGLCLKVMSWPEQISYVLMLTNSLISIASSALLYQLCVAFTRLRALSFVVALLFMMSADLVVLEYNSLGQTIYENSCLVWILMFVLGGSHLASGRETRGVLFMSVSAACLIMTRSAYTYFFVVPLILILVARPTPLKKYLGIFLLIWAGTHGAWIVKNAVIYDRLSLSTSSWQGANLAQGLVNAGYEEPFRAHILSNTFGAPDWFVEYVGSEPRIPIWGAASLGRLPEALRDKSSRINERLNGQNRLENTLAFAEYVKPFEGAYMTFAIENPVTIAKKVYTSYRIFWSPIRYYGAYFLSLFKVEAVIQQPLDIRATLSLWMDGRLPESQWVKSGKYPDFQSRQASLFTIDFLSPLIAILTVIAIHIFMPYQCIRQAWGVVRRRGFTPESLGYLNLALVIGYSFFVFVLVEHGENMRFRLSIEPVIWLCVALMLASGWRMIQDRLNFKQDAR